MTVVPMLFGPPSEGPFFALGFHLDVKGLLHLCYAVLLWCCAVFKFMVSKLYGQFSYDKVTTTYNKWRIGVTTSNIKTWTML